MKTTDHGDLATVASVDLSRYLGTWYEIARLPMRHEDRDATDITAHYSLQDDGKVRVENRCFNADGEPELAVGEAVPIDASNARLEVSFLPEGLRWVPFTKGDYWIMRLDPDYTTALVGGPDRKYLWLLCRRPAMDEQVEREWLEFASGQGFDLSGLIRPRHTGRDPVVSGD